MGNSDDENQSGQGGTSVVGERTKSERCPKFGGNQGEYYEWRIKVMDWLYKWEKNDKFPGLTVRMALSGEALRIDRNELAKGKNGLDLVMKVLDQKYGIEKKREILIV